MTNSKTSKRGHGRLAILERRDEIEAMLNRGYRASEIYRKLQDELGITKSVFHKHLTTLGITNNEFAISENQNQNLTENVLVNEGTQNSSNENQSSCESSSNSDTSEQVTKKKFHHTARPRDNLI